MRHSAHGKPETGMMQLTKGHIYCLIICVTLIICTVISTFGR